MCNMPKVVPILLTLVHCCENQKFHWRWQQKLGPSYYSRFLSRAVDFSAWWGKVLLIYILFLYFFLLFQETYVSWKVTITAGTGLSRWIYFFLWAPKPWKEYKDQNTHIFYSHRNYHAFLFTHISFFKWGYSHFCRIFCMGYQTKKSEKAKLVTSWLRLTMDYFPKYKNQNQILKTYRIYFDWPVWPQSDQS